MSRNFKIVKLLLDKSIFNENIIHIILTQYWNLIPKTKTLLEWIPLENLDWLYLSLNINAIDLLKNNIDKINTHCLSININAVKLLENNYDKIDWRYLSANKNAIHLLEQNKDKIAWGALSGNKNAIHLLEEKAHYIYWNRLSLNKNAMHLIAEYQCNIEIDWNILSRNPSIFEDEHIPL